MRVLYSVIALRRHSAYVGWVSSTLYFNQIFNMVSCSSDAGGTQKKDHLWDTFGGEKGTKNETLFGLRKG